MSKYHVLSFYGFSEIFAPTVQEQLLELGAKLHLGGLVIVADEGVNGTISAGTKEGTEAFSSKVQELTSCEELMLKYSTSSTNPYKNFRVKKRDEIVTSEFGITMPKGRHLSPKEWDSFIEENPDAVILDTRNWYETKIGIFKNAVDLEMNHFTDFPEKIQEHELDKKSPVLMYCTGGIRCEKASVLMENMGFENVYQLEGGILRYFEETPAEKFDGECFVFDDRVAVDKELKESEGWKLCPHTGQPGHEKLQCTNCGKKAVVSPEAYFLGKEQTCSKDCAEQFRRRLAF